MKKIYIALTLILGLSACQTTVDDAFTQISRDTGGLVNFHTPTTLKARKEALILYALNTQEDQSWKISSNYCNSSQCYINVDVGSVAYNDGEAYSVEMRVTDNIDGKYKNSEKRKYLKKISGWSLVSKR